MQAYRSSSLRSATFTERKPVPIGVVIGPLRATLFLRMLSTTFGGSGVPAVSMISTPASTTSQLNATPVASRTFFAAATSSGPVPSPRISVTLCAKTILLLRFSPASHRRDAGDRLKNYSRFDRAIPADPGIENTRQEKTSVFQTRITGRSALREKTKGAASPNHQVIAVDHFVEAAIAQHLLELLTAQPQYSAHLHGSVIGQAARKDLAHLIPHFDQIPAQKLARHLCDPDRQ